jgi:hypothetical protein
VVASKLLLLQEDAVNSDTNNKVQVVSAKELGLMKTRNVNEDFQRPPPPVHKEVAGLKAMNDQLGSFET